MAKASEKDTKACKSFNCKQNKSYDDNNFQQIIAPGYLELVCRIFVFIIFCSFISSYFDSSSFWSFSHLWGFCKEC